jgi:hypothetical protein
MTSQPLVAECASRLGVLNSRSSSVSSRSVAPATATLPAATDSTDLLPGKNPKAGETIVLARRMQETIGNQYKRHRSEISGFPIDSPLLRRSTPGRKYHSTCDPVEMDMIYWYCTDIRQIKSNTFQTLPEFGQTGWTCRCKMISSDQPLFRMTSTSSIFH